MKENKITETENIENIFIIPMKGCPVFPGLLTTIEVTEQIDLLSVKYSDRQKGFGLLLLKPNDKEDNNKEFTMDDFYSIGTYVRVKNKINTIYGSKSLYLETICRFKVIQLESINGVINATVEFIKEKALDPITNRAYMGAIKKALSLRDDNSFLMNNLRMNAMNISESIRLTDYLASMIVPKDRQQEFLENLDAQDRMKEILKVLQEELTVQKMQEEIQVTVSKQLENRQKEYFLREELAEIKKQIARIHRENNKTEEIDTENDIDDIFDVLEDEIEVPENQSNPFAYYSSKDDKVENKSQEQDKKESTKTEPRKKKLIDRLKELNLSGEAYETVFEEYNRLQSTERINPDYSIIKGYLELVADLPWNTLSEEKIDLIEAKKILDKDHYGIKDVKERILEFLAVRKLKTDNKGSIICLVGPPGTGKTSIGMSIAKALGKKYYRFSVGGMRDEAEIKGHRRTYIGSMPGQIIKGLKICKTKNPVFVIDEIDKMISSVQGDPAAAMLEVLDPEQNTAFRDHYLDIPFDISNVFFIVTANTVDTIPRPLLDRMEVIELNGYTPEEKLHIGKKYLVPKTREKNGLKTADIKFPDSILRKIATEYAREAGVRNFEKAIDKVERKVAMKLVLADLNKEEIKRPVTINSDYLIEYLGQPIFREDEIIKADKAGMAVGLAWTSMGGDTLAIESQIIPGKGDLNLTGQLGDVMKESASIAFSYVKSIAPYYGISNSFFKENNIHLHVPEGATPKDGPSAGITMACALFSLATGVVMKPDLAMTGELSLLGKVMPIGGLKEKVLAAGRNKIKEIIIPKQNQRDLDKIEENVKKGIEFHAVGSMEEVLSVAFPNVQRNKDVQKNKEV